MAAFIQRIENGPDPPPVGGWQVGVTFRGLEFMLPQNIPPSTKWIPLARGSQGDYILQEHEGSWTDSDAPVSPAPDVVMSIGGAAAPDDVMSMDADFGSDREAENTGHANGQEAAEGNEEPQPPAMEPPSMKSLQQGTQQLPMSAVADSSTGQDAASSNQPAVAGQLAVAGSRQQPDIAMLSLRNACARMNRSYGMPEDYGDPYTAEHYSTDAENYEEARSICTGDRQ